MARSEEKNLTDGNNKRLLNYRSKGNKQIKYTWTKQVSSRKSEKQSKSTWHEACESDNERGGQTFGRWKKDT